MELQRILRFWEVGALETADGDIPLSGKSRKYLADALAWMRNNSDSPPRNYESALECLPRYGVAIDRMFRLGSHHNPV